MTIKLKRVYLISTVGQARNAWGLTQSLSQDVSENCYFVLQTIKSPQVLAAVNFLSSHGCRVRSVKLPNKPNSGRLSVIRRAMESYQSAFKNLDFEELWIANTNHHYSAIAHELAKSGKDIFFYEDGIGSYKKKNELLVYTPIKLAFKNFAYGVIKEFKKIFTRLRKFFTAISSRFLDFLFSLFIIRRTIVKLLPLPYRNFFDVYTDFTGIYVYYPNLIDKNAFLGPAHSISRDLEDFELTHKETKKLEKYFSSSSNTGTLYVSQMYGSGQRAWSNVICSQIKEHAIGTVYVKFHPRERYETRAEFLDVLFTYNLTAFDVDNSNEIDCMKIIANFDFNVVIGLTSSVLFYGATVNRNIKIVSIADAVIRLSKRNSYLRSEYNHLLQDYRIFSRLTQKK